MKKLLVLCTCLIMLTACAKGPQPEDFPQTFELRSKASKKVSNDLIIRFSMVLEDSRCPVDVECVTEGNAEILLEMSGGDLESTSQVSLRVPDGTARKLNDFRIGSSELSLS
ncbi:MAG: hypothetical protein D3908_13440 [Candidatus Electrothrix sp. AUS4]|nr:hypothetical protein [Candidatus Electrothrix sp. AUS4]